MPILLRFWPYLAVAALLWVSYLWAFNRGVEHQKSVDAKEQEIVESDIRKKGAASTEASGQVTTVYVDRVRTVEKKIYVHLKDNAAAITDADNSVVSGSVVRVHNATVQTSNGDAKSSSNSDAGAAETATDLRSYTDQVIRNYGTCGSIREQLISLQTWLKEQDRIYNQP